MKKIFCLFLFASSILLSGCTTKINFEKEVVKIINSELSNYIFQSYADYETGETVSTNLISNDVASALLLLNNKLTIDLNNLLESAESSIEEVKSDYEDMVIYDVYSAFNMILVYNLLELDLTRFEEYFTELTLEDISTGYVWDVYTHITAINCLSMLNVNSELKQTLIAKYDTIAELEELAKLDDYFSLDADLISSLVISFQGNAPTEFKTLLVKFIESDGVHFYGEPGCSSTAMVVIAMLSEGLIYNQNKLSDVLLDFKIDGGFKQYLDDTTVDLSYASPQGFAALASTFLYEETGSKVVLY